MSRPVIQRLESGQAVGFDSLLRVLSALGRLEELSGLLQPRRAQTLDEALRGPLPGLLDDTMPDAWGLKVMDLNLSAGASATRR